MSLYNFESNAKSQKQRKIQLKCFWVEAISIPWPFADSGASLNSESHTPQPFYHRREMCITFRNI